MSIGRVPLATTTCAGTKQVVREGENTTTDMVRDQEGVYQRVMFLLHVNGLSPLVTCVTSVGGTVLERIGRYLGAAVLARLFQRGEAFDK